MKKFYLLIAIVILCLSTISCDEDEKEPQKLKHGNSILHFEIGGFPVTIEAGKISFTVAQTIDLSNLTPIIRISDGATISPALGVAQDFTNPVIYTVTSEGGVSRTYEVSARILYGLSRFNVLHSGVVYIGLLHHANREIEVVADFPIMRRLQSAGIPAQIDFDLSEEYSASLAQNSVIDLDNPGEFVITSAGKTFPYSIVIKNSSSAPRSVQLEADPLIPYSLAEGSYPDHLEGISGDAIILRTLSDVNLVNVALHTFTYAERATISPDPTQNFDFSVDRNFTITSETGSARQFKLRVIKDDFLMEFDRASLTRVTILANGFPRILQCESVSPVTGVSLTNVDDNSVVNCTFRMLTMTRRFYLEIDPINAFPLGNYRLNVTLANGKSLQIRRILRAVQ
jgi:hypothetical protein